MKKIRGVFPVLLLACAGIVIMSCPSEPEPGETIKDPDIILKMLSEPAQHKEPVKNLLFVEGKTYEVTLAVSSLDETLVGGFFGGVLLYEPGNGAAAVRVSAWSHSGTGAIVNGARNYKWDFVATASAPSEMQNMQYFELIAQNSSYKNYKEDDVFGIKGSISVKEKGAVDPNNYTVTEVTVTPGSGTVVAIESGEYDRVSAAKNTAGSFLRLYVVTKSGNIGKIGPDQGKAGDYLNLNSNDAGIIDVDLQDLFAVNDTNYININIWSPTNPQDGLTKVELWVKK